MTSNYAQQAALVIKAIPLIAKEDIFALKGGTAINLYICSEQMYVYSRRNNL